MVPAVGVEAVLAGAAPATKNRVALVTGGHCGIGLEVALVMAESGAVAYCLDLPAEPNTDWLKVQNYAAQLPGDVTDQQRMRKAVESIVKREGRIDICIANAGIVQSLDYPGEESRKRIMDVDVCGVLLAAQAAGRQMEQLKIPGSIVLMGSTNGSAANRNQFWTAYNTSKSAVLQMGRSLAVELAPKDIRVNVVSPGYTHTPIAEKGFRDKPDLEAELSEQNPMGRFGKPDEIRGVVLWLASDASSFCTGSE
ncbi:hypothetical protein C8R43DRAFT_1099808 [Mycena crocata]|nr:hypothetical protein C8R43DRAFT_1099808 [Mycena crocata]